MILHVGTTKDNFTAKQIAEYVQEIVPNSEIEFAENVTKDKRSYKVNFDKIEQILGYKTKRNLKESIQELYENFKNKNFTESDFMDDRFYRVKFLRLLLKNGSVNNELKVINR